MNTEVTQIAFTLKNKSLYRLISLIAPSLFKVYVLLSTRGFRSLRKRIEEKNRTFSCYYENRVLL